MSPPVWGIAEIARHYDVTKQAVNSWAQSQRFPAPTYELGAGRFWLARDVRRWARTFRPDLRRD